MKEFRTVRDVLKSFYSFMSVIDPACANDPTREPCVIQHDLTFQINIEGISGATASALLAYSQGLMTRIRLIIEETDFKFFTKYSGHDPMEPFDRNYNVQLYFKVWKPFSLVRYKNGSRPNRKAFVPFSALKLG
jgi:hypothetical protein